MLRAGLGAGIRGAIIIGVLDGLSLAYFPLSRAAGRRAGPIEWLDLLLFLFLIPYSFLGYSFLFFPLAIPPLAGFWAGRSGGTSTAAAKAIEVGPLLKGSALYTRWDGAGAGAIAGLVTGGFNIVVLRVLWNVSLGQQGRLSPLFWGESLDRILLGILWWVGAPVVLGAMGGVVGWVRPARAES